MFFLFKKNLSGTMENKQGKNKHTTGKLLATQGHKHITKGAKHKHKGINKNTTEGDRIYSRTQTQPNQNRMTLTELVKSV